MYLVKEFSYDTQHKLGNRLYQVGTFSIMEDREDRSAHTPAPMAAAMQQEYPEVESATRLMKLFQDDKTLFQYQKGKELRSFYEMNGYMADSTFFRIFSYDFTEGHAATALEEPNSLVISEPIAKKIFGEDPAIGKIIHINSTTVGSYDFKITGVFRTSATPSHIDASFFLSMQSGDVAPWLQHLTDMANNNLFFTYLVLKKGADPKALETKFDAFIEKYAGAELKASGRNRKQFLTPVRDIHLYAVDGNVTPGGSVSYLYILLSIAIVTLLIACVNFMNLSTARSSKRAVEIGVRKVLGAQQKSLVWQFLWEAILLSLVAFILSVGLAKLLTPLFERISGKELVFSSGQYAALLLTFLVMTILTGLLAGIYPSFYLSAFKPVKVLKGKFSNSLSAITFRKALVVFQFVISVALIVASITIGNQMRYLRNKDLGFQKDQQIILPLRTSNAKNVFASLKNSLSSHTALTSVGAAMYYPGVENTMDWLLFKQGAQQDQTVDIYMNRVDESYLQTLGIKPVAGRLFSKEFPADSANRIIINEQAIKDFGFASASDAIGKNLVMSWKGEQMLYPIVGVVKDFHFKGLHSKIQSYGFLTGNAQSFGFLVAQAKGPIKEALGQMESAWSKLNPNEPFEYSFLDQDFQKNYIAEERLAALIRYFTIVAIFISCLGLFGLTTFSVEQRTREIGIRKVLGASTTGIVSLLSKDFIKLVLISFLVASPLAWYFINKWLEDFAYKAPFTVWMLLGGCAVALLIAFLTISIQAVKVALSNPVDNLRTE
jgi:putative ABC transport system permease protein